MNMPRIPPKNQGVKRIRWLKSGKNAGEVSVFRVFFFGNAEFTVIEFSIELLTIIIANGNEADKRCHTTKKDIVKSVHSGELSFLSAELALPIQRC